MGAEVGPAMKGDHFTWARGGARDSAIRPTREGRVEKLEQAPTQSFPEIFNVIFDQACRPDTKGEVVGFESSWV